ncbi:TPA: hypothetical protein ACJL6F_000142 [Neisseria meningitidis]
MFQIDFADGEYAFHRRLIAEFAAQGITGIGRINDHAAFIDDFDRLLDEAFLGVVGMNGEKLCHSLCPYRHVFRIVRPKSKQNAV